MASKQQLRLVLVTPEKTLLDIPVHALRFPLYDGLMGVLPGRAPLVGRLGIGNLNYSDTSQSQHDYFVDGGFVQVKGEVVTILTNRAVAAKDVNRPQAEEQLRTVRSRATHNDAEIDAKQTDLMRARQMIAVSRKS